jgi:uncharacterized delta-60 repeat protein
MLLKTNKLNLVINLLLTLAISFGFTDNSVLAAAGDVDTSFNAAIGVVPSGSVYRTAIQPDGKIIISGDFRYVSGKARTNLARLNQDGTTDTSFNPPAFTCVQSPCIRAIGIQSNGKIILGGSLETINGTLAQKGLARLNQDGSLDSAFTNNPTISTFGATNDLKITPNDKILATGVRFGSALSYVLLRLSADGIIENESAYNNFLGKIGLQNDGKVITTIATGTNASLVRINPDGLLDAAFTVSTLGAGVTSVVLQPDGKFVIGGGFTQINGFTVRGLARFNPDGSFDTTFNNNGFGPSSGVESVVLLPNGKFLIGGFFGAYNTVVRANVARINPDGSLDTTFFPGFNFNSSFAVFDVDLQTDGQIIVSSGPSVSNPSDNSRQRLMRLAPEGAIDSTFRGAVGTTGASFKVLALSDGKFLLGGRFSDANGVSRVSIARFNNDSSLDSNFNLSTNLNRVVSLFQQSDGGILAATDVGAWRASPNGTISFGFFSSSIATDIKELSDGRILISSPQFSLSRYNSTGTRDTTFNSPTVSPLPGIQKFLIQPDGKILICGTFTSINTFGRGRIARLNADGTLDTTFNPPGGANDTVYDLALQTDGKVIIGGNFSGVNFNIRRYLARLNADGSLDPTFVPDVNNTVHSLKLQPNGKLLVGGTMTTINGLSRIGLARLNVDGSVDTSFNVGSGANGIVWSIDLQTDNKILLGGEFTRFNNVAALGVARLLNDSNVPRSTLFDFDGDSKADVSVFRSSINRWYQILSGNSQVTEQNFGINGDIIAPADFDGDGKTDIAIFRSQSGDWWYKSSINGNQILTHWGANGDIPRPADFDGDGKADFIVYRPTNNVWYRLGSTGQTSIVPFGAAGDKPVLGDFDGDGKADVAIYRPQTGQWWYQSSIDNVQRATQFGISTDTPVAADYDGDGKTDLAVYRSQTGVWYILNSSNNSFTVVPFGLPEDKPVPADYDGDGRADIAVFRPSTGIWYLLRSSAGFTALQFGISTDTPIPNAFVP